VAQAVRSLVAFDSIVFVDTIEGSSRRRSDLGGQPLATNATTT
jgi:hypothetical protein